MTMTEADPRSPPVTKAGGHFRRLRRLPGWVVAPVVPALIYVFWLRASHGSSGFSGFIPTPHAVWATFVQMVNHGYKGHSLGAQCWATFSKVLYAFLIVIGIGVPLGFLMGRNRIMRALLDPIVEFIRPLPALAYLSLLVLWFGVGLRTQLILLVVSSLPVEITSVRSVAMSVPEEHLRTARVFGASGVQLFWHVMVPASVPELISGARIIAGLLLGTIVAAEMIAAQEGLGWMILDASNFLQANVIFVGIFLLAGMGLAIDRFFRVVQHFAAPWQGKQ